MGIPFKRFDQIVLGCIFLLALLVALTWGFGGARGNRALTSVQQFSWEGRPISVADKSFTLSFNQAVDPKFVAKNLVIDPPLLGKLSWVGKKFFFTLTDRPIYGQDYQIKLAEPEGKTAQKPTIEAFVSRFKTRDRAFAYIGTEDKDRGRLILYNLTQQQKSILTPADLIVLNFDVYPEGDRLLFSAIPRGAANTNVGDQQLYTVTTGLNYAANTEAIAAGQIRPILDTAEYSNGQFQLAENGQRIIIQRTSRKDPRDRSLWVIDGDAEPRALGIPADEFLLSPDAAIIAVTQQNKLSMVPLGRNGGAIKAKEEYSRLLAFSPDQTQQIALQYLDGGINSLYVIDAKGKERLLLRTLTPIVECQFEPRHAEMLYCLKIDESEHLGKKANEPFLSVINLQTSEETPLLALPNYHDVRLSISADGLALLFDQVVTAAPTRNTDLFTNSGLAVEGGRLWLLTLPELGSDTNIQPVAPESLMPGYLPQWIP